MRFAALALLLLFFSACSLRPRPTPPTPWMPDPTLSKDVREVTGQSIVFLGDSLTHIGWWRKWFPDVVTANAGWGGDTTLHVLARLDEVTSKKPRAIFLLIGGNDILQDFNLAITTAAHAKIISRIQAETPDTDLYVMTIFPMGEDLEEYIPSINPRYRQNIDALNQALLIVCAQHDVSLLPIGEAYLRNSRGYLKKIMTADRVHLQQPGYAAWIEGLLPALAKYRAPSGGGAPTN